MENLIKYEDQGTIQAFSPDAIKEQIALIQKIMKDAMQEDVHYGKIPGCGNKPTLLKAGAEKLNLTFRLAPHIEKIDTINLGNGHREHVITTKLININTGAIWAYGIGSCSTMESKYRYRNDNQIEFTDIEVPKEYWKNRDNSILGKNCIAKKNDAGKWVIAKKISTGKIENPDIADIYNTVLKMAKKRSLVDATINATAASDIFTQDIEDFPKYDFSNQSTTKNKKIPTEKKSEIIEPEIIKDDTIESDKIKRNLKLINELFEKNIIDENTKKTFINKTNTANGDVVLNAIYDTLLKKNE